MAVVGVGGSVSRTITKDRTDIERSPILIRYRTSRHGRFV